MGWIIACTALGSFALGYGIRGWIAVAYLRKIRMQGMKGRNDR
jgi:hypothetical protein